MEGKAASMNSIQGSSAVDPDDLNKPFHGWSKEVSPRCELPWVEQDYSGHDLCSPFQMKPSLTICMVAEQKDKSPDLKGSSFEKSTDQVFPASLCGVEPNVNNSRADLRDKTDYCEDKLMDSPSCKPKNVEVKRKPSKRPQPKVSDKGQERTSERKKLKSLGWKLRCKMLNVRKTCRKCLKKSKSYNLNIMHEQLEHPYVCQICTDHLFSFIDANALKRHEDQIHSPVTLETDSQKTSYSKALENEHVTKNISECNVILVDVMPKIFKKSYRCERGVKEGVIKIVSVNNGYEIGTDVTKQSIQKHDSNSKQTVKEEKIITELKPDKQLDVNKNESLSDRGLKPITLNLIKPGTSVASTPTVHKNGTSWKDLKDRLKSPESHNSNYIQANQPQQLQHKKTVTLPERAAIDAGPIDDMNNLWNTNLFAPSPATLATESTRETSPCVKLKASSTAANLKGASVVISGVKLSNPMSGDMKDRMIRSAMRGKGRVKTRGGVWPRMQMGRGVLGMEGQRPRIQMGREAIGLQDQRPRMQVGPGVIGMQGQRPRMQMGREAIGMQGQRPPGIYGAPHRPSCAGRENLKSPGVSGASPMESFIPRASYIPQLPRDRERVCKPASKISTGPVVPVDPNNLPPAPKPIIIKVETIDISDEDSPPTSTDDMLDRLKTSMPGISVTRNITPTKLKGL